MSIDDEVIEDLLQKIEGGLPLRAVCLHEGIPDIVVVQEYMRRNPAVMEKLRQAKAVAKAKIEQDAAFKAAALNNRAQYIEGQRNGG